MARYRTTRCQLGQPDAPAVRSRRPARGDRPRRAVVRRFRDADRARRDVVLSRLADRAAAAGQAVRTVLRRGPDGGTGWSHRSSRAGSRSRTCRSSAVELRCEGSGPSQLLELRTNLDEWVPVNAAHPLELRDQADGAQLPYVRVRDKLDARVARSVFYHLVELAEPARMVLMTAGGLERRALLPPGLGHE